MSKVTEDKNKLRDVLIKSYRNKAKDKIVKKAIKKRISDKKAQKKGMKLVKVRSHNLKQPLHTEASGALKARKERRGANDRKNDAARKAAKPTVRDRIKKNVFGLGKAVSNIMKMKNDPKKNP